MACRAAGINKTGNLSWILIVTPPWSTAALERWFWSTPQVLWLGWQGKSGPKWAASYSIIRHFGDEPGLDGNNYSLHNAWHCIMLILVLIVSQDHKAVTDLQSRVVSAVCKILIHDGKLSAILLLWVLTGATQALLLAYVLNLILMLWVIVYTRKLDSFNRITTACFSISEEDRTQLVWLLCECSEYDYMPTAVLCEHFLKRISSFLERT